MSRDYTSREMTHYYCPECGAVTPEDATCLHTAPPCALCNGTGALDYHAAVGAWEPCPNGCSEMDSDTTDSRS